MFIGKNDEPDPSQVKLIVTAKTRVADEVVALTLAHPDGRRLPDWTPGSHVDVVLPSGANRQYSLCGDRWDAHSYRIAVLHDPAGRGGSTYIHEELTAGNLLAVGGPRNNFRLVPSGKYLFIAGGIGITPMLPMIRQAEMLGADWKLLYLGRARSTMAFLDELAAYGDRVVVLPKDESGPSPLEKLIGGPAADTKVYVCGPQRLLAAVEDHCAAWPAGLLRLEHFAAKAQGAPARDLPFEVELARAGLSVTVPPDAERPRCAARCGSQYLHVVPGRYLRNLRGPRSGGCSRPPRLHPHRRGPCVRELHVPLRLPLSQRPPRS